MTLPRQIFLFLAAAAALLIAGAELPAEETIFSVPAGSSPVYGSQEAPVTVIEFIDYQ